MWAKNKQSGFTIVELLIVIVVIGILAAITIVAFNGIQQRGRDSVRTSAINGVKKALELYRIDNGVYPSVGTDGSGYNLSALSAALVPTYTSSIPVDPSSPLNGTYDYKYVRQTPGVIYAIKINYETRTPCHDGVGNSGIGFWSLAAC